MNVTEIEGGSFGGLRIASLTFLVAGLGSNLFLAVAFLAGPWSRTPLVVDRIVGLLGFNGLLTAILATPLAFLVGRPPSENLCQLQGFFLNLSVLLSVWYTATLAAERITRVLCPHEHILTFSLLNSNVILAGILVLLLIEVCGPVYGWAQYGLLEDLGVCFVNTESNHIFSYAMIHVVCYVAAPGLATLIAVLFILIQISRKNVRITRGSQVLKSFSGMGYLSIAMLSSTLLLLPFQMVVLLQASNIYVSKEIMITLYWIKIIGITFIYPGILLGAVETQFFANTGQLTSWDYNASIRLRHYTSQTGLAYIF